MTLLLFTRLRSEAEKDEVISVKKLIHSTFISQVFLVPSTHFLCLFVLKDEVNKTTKEGEGGSCLTPIISKLSCASLSPLHIPSPSSTCSCYLCLEYRYNPSFAFLSSKVSFLYRFVWGLLIFIHKYLSTMKKEYFLQWIFEGSCQISRFKIQWYQKWFRSSAAEVNVYVGR